MRIPLSPLVATVLFGPLVGCAHEEELRPAREPRTDMGFESAPPAPPPSTSDPPPAARPRLSQTITLGQQDYSPSAPPRPAAAQNTGVNVTVNNNVNVAPPVVYGGYGYGYGGYGYGGTRGDGRTGVGAGRTGLPGITPWAASGWEGAQRTAAPGRTPGVGGNWAPPPSYGPAQMK